MAATGTLGARLYVSATPLTDVDAAADAIGDFQALTITTEIGLITSFGDFGRVFQGVPVQLVQSGRTYKLRGGSDDGQFTLQVAQDLSDSGQAALLSYVASNQFTYPFKVTLVGADASYDTVYFGGKVMGFRTVMGGANSVLSANITIELNTPVFTGAS